MKEISQRIARIVITTISSTRVKAFLCCCKFFVVTLLDNVILGLDPRIFPLSKLFRMFQRLTLVKDPEINSG